MIEAVAALEDALSGVSALTFTLAWLMGYSGGENTDNAASFVRWSCPIYIEFFV
jgi:hypothetical protein